MADATAEAFLRAIQPYVIIKKRQVELALEFRALAKLPKNERCNFDVKPVAGLTNRVVAIRKPEIMQAELAIKQRMHELNRKGVSA